AVLEADVDWSGFSKTQEQSVIRRAINGEEPEFWMDDLEKGSHVERQYGNPKIYEVWHDKGWPESRIAQATGIEGGEGSFPADYVHVANVQANSLRQAVEITTDTGGIIDDPRQWQPWEKNEGVEALVTAPRDTVPGDVIVDPQGQPYRVEEFEHSTKE